MCLVSSARSPERPVCYAPWRPQKWWTLHKKGEDRNTWTLSGTPQVPGATGYRSMLASCARVTGFLPSHSLVLSSHTEPAPAVPMSLGNNLEMKWHPQPGGIPRITWKAEQSPKNVLACSHSCLQAQPTVAGRMPMERHTRSSAACQGYQLPPAPARTLGCCSNYREAQRLCQWMAGSPSTEGIPLWHAAGPSGTTQPSLCYLPSLTSSTVTVQSTVAEPEKTWSLSFWDAFIFQAVNPL